MSSIEIDTVETIVIGAGVVGLAVAARLAQSLEVLLLEKNAHIGEETSSRNSEVIHAGIYYARDSLKAQLCIKGNRALYDYCQSHSVAHRNTGKLIVATTEQEAAQLQKISKQAYENGVVDLEPLDQKQIESIEPHVRAVAGLFSPSTGIVNAHELMQALLVDLTSASGQLATHSDVIAVERIAGHFHVHCSISGKRYTIRCRNLVNAAGLHAQKVANTCDFLPNTTIIPRLHLCKGIYFSYSGGRPFRHLIYPIPEVNQAGLGIHATLDLEGHVKFGPDTEFVESVDYSIPDVVPEEYLDAIRQYFPTIRAEKLRPDYAGVRPKLSAQGEKAEDFSIQGATDHHVEGYVQLFGIESPGLTASLAIAELVETKLL